MTRLLAIIALALTACTQPPRNPQAAVEREINACLPAAITMREGLVKSGVWAEVLVVHWRDAKDRPRGHAYAIYLYPPAKNQLWAYDNNHGSTRIHAYKNDARMVAFASMFARNIYGNITSAEWLQ